jgi:hypothetical protein
MVHAPKPNQAKLTYVEGCNSERCMRLCMRLCTRLLGCAAQTEAELSNELRLTFLQARR